MNKEYQELEEYWHNQHKNVSKRFAIEIIIFISIVAICVNLLIQACIFLHILNVVLVVLCVAVWKFKDNLSYIASEDGYLPGEQISLMKARIK